MDSILFQDVTIVDVHSTWNGKKADVLIENGKIQKIAHPHSLTSSKTTTGGYLSTGWVDMRC